MEERDSRNLRYLEEFELVNGTNQGVYTEKDVYIQPKIGKNGMIQYRIYDAENNEIGVVEANKRITLSNEYIQKKKLEGKELGFDFDSAQIEVDIQEMLDRQMEKEQELQRTQAQPTQNQTDKDVKEQTNTEDDKKKVLPQQTEQQKTPSNEIEDEELEQQGYNITAYSKIKDQTVIDAMIVTTIDPRSVIVAEVDGQFKFLGKEIGTGEIVELQERVGGNKQAEEVNKFEGNVEKKKGRGTTMIMTDYGNMEFNIEKNGHGQIEVGYISDVDGDGTREVIPVETDVVHPTMEEYQRAQIEQYKKYGNYDFARDDAIMTGQEIEDRLADEEESIRDEVTAELEEQEENPTSNQLEEMIEDEKEEQEQEQETDEQEKEEQEEEWEFGRPRPRPRY